MKDNEDNKKIQIIKDGPFIVSGNVPLTLEQMVPDENGASISYKKVKTYETVESYALCRCGHTHHSPFCDGMHEEVGFTAEPGEHKIYAEEAVVIKGRTTELLDQDELCVGARFCDRFGGVWALARSSRNNHPEYERAEIEEACLCPAGRLTVRKDGVEIEFEFPREIALLEDIYNEMKGPIFVKGGISIVDENGDEYEIRNRRTLCRCGESENKPFCDASHFYCEHMEGSDL